MPRRSLVFRRDWRARTNEIAIAIGIVDSSNGRPELGCAGPGGGKSRALAGIGMLPIVGGNRRGGVRGVLQEIISAIGFALLDLADFFADQDQGVAESV